MSRTLVVSQPMFLPWVGLFEQIRLADCYVHYDDVDLPQGRSFMSRVQLRNRQGVFWLGVPIDRRRSGRALNEAYYLAEGNWRGKHIETLRHTYSSRPHYRAMENLVQKIYGQGTDNLAQFNGHAIEHIAKHLHLEPEFLRSSELKAPGSSSARLINLCKLTNCDTYVTGHGARNYLDHEGFESEGIVVKYIDYRKIPYNQGQGDFTPYVSSLDAIANCAEAADLLQSEAVHWKQFVLDKPHL